MLPAFPVGRLPRPFPGLRRTACVDHYVTATLDRTPGDAWTLALVPMSAWAVLDALRWGGWRPSRSAVAEDALRRALAEDVVGAA